MTANYSSIV